MCALVTRIAVTITAAVVSIPVSAAGPPPRGVEQALKDQRLISFTADRASVAPGRSILFRWDVQGPGGGVTVRLNGQTVARTGMRSITPVGRDETYRLVAVSGDLTRELGARVVGVNPCVPGAPPAAQCQRAGAAKGDYARMNADFFFFKAADFHDPKSRDVALDGCATDPGRHGRIERYSWTVTRLGFPTRWFSSDQCKIATRLGEGTYLAQLSAHAADGATLETGFPIQIKDIIVVSVGDSMAGGEGNPDVGGAYIPPLPGHSTAQWKDAGCHRSAFGGHVRAAQRLATDPHNGIVFLSLACTGAKAENLATSANRGRPPQLRQLAAALCAYGCARPIDLLIMTIGVNDVDFAQLTRSCVITHEGCDATLTRAEGNLATLPLQYARLRDEIGALRLTVKHLLITGYPAHVFTGSCADSAARIQRLGRHLNDTIRQAAQTYGWTYVDGVTPAFDGHDYCARSSRWFVNLNDSLATQGDVDGTAHPNHVGQEALANLIVAAYERLAP
jgi:lysophospholipase L1-like esterase